MRHQLGIGYLFMFLMGALHWSGAQHPQEASKATKEKGSLPAEGKGEEEKERGSNAGKEDRRTATLVVKVTVGGEPLRSARVWVTNEREYDVERTTNESGKATFSGVPRERVLIQANAPGGLRTGKHADVTSNMETVQLDLPRPVEAPRL